MKIGATVGVVGGIFATLTAINVFWGDYGWPTNKTYKIDHGERSAIAQFRQEWKCDEWSEEIPDHEKNVERALRWLNSLDESDPKHEIAEDRYYSEKHIRDSKKQAFDEANCEALVQ